MLVGDSYIVVFIDDGCVFFWGFFWDNNGVIGLLEFMKKSMVFV